MLDPGIGFGKTPEQSIIAIARLAELQCVRPAAPDRRVAQALHRHRSSPAPPDRRLGGSIAAHLLRSQNGADDRARARCRRDRAGAAGRRRHPERTMSDTDLHHRACLARLSRRDAARGQGRPDASSSISMLDIDLDRGLALRQARGHRVLRPGGRRRERGVLRAALPAGRGRRRRRGRGAARQFPAVTRVRVTVHKPHAPIAATFDDVGVIDPALARQDRRHG